MTRLADLFTFEEAPEMHGNIVMGVMLASLTGCATIVEGPRQEIDVYTIPGDANCGLYRQDAKIAEVLNTPGAAFVNKTNDDITVLCLKNGYQTMALRNHSDVAMATFGNIVNGVLIGTLGGVIGWVIDRATGADNKYESAVYLRMDPLMPAGTRTMEIPEPAPPSTLPWAPPSS
jgi:hypothetical protein